MLFKPRQTSWYDFLNNKLGKDYKIAFYFLLPTFLIVLILIAYPIVLSLFLALSNVMVGDEFTWDHFVGFKNFKEIFGNRIYQRALVNTSIYTFGSVIFKIVLGMIMALLLLNPIKGKPWIRGLLLLPWVVPTVLSALTFRWLFDRLFSPINYILRTIGIVDFPGIPFLSNPTLAMLSVILVNIWKGIPFFGLCFLAGIETIPKDLFDAAEIDGASATQRFFLITLPLIMPVFVVVTLISLVWTFADFEIVYVMTRGGPYNTTHLLSTLAFSIGIESHQLGKGASIALTLFPIIAISAYFIIRNLRQE